MRTVGVLSGPAARQPRSEPRTRGAPPRTVDVGVGSPLDGHVIDLQ